MCGLLNAQEGDYLLWNIERTITKIYIPVLLDSCMGDKGTKDLLTKVRESYQREWFKSNRLKKNHMKRVQINKNGSQDKNISLVHL